MTQPRIAGVRLRRRVRTTITEASDQKVPDLVKRDFTAPTPTRRYVGDIAYRPLASGENLYLATVIDCYSRRLAGWAIADHMRTDLITTALRDAANTRGTLTGAVFHADHGAQYTSKAFEELCGRLGVKQSMGSVGSWDNALAESWFSSLKTESLARQTWPTRTAARTAAVSYISWFNGTRKHHTLGYLTPAQYEQQAATSPALQAIA